MKPWYKKDPATLEREKAETLGAFPELSFSLEQGKVWVSGPLVLRNEAGREVDRYEIAICLPDDYPRSVPTLFETGGKVRRHEDEHAYSNGEICLFVFGERWQHWPVGKTLRDFIEGPVRGYFIAHAHFRQTGDWPWGDRSHSEVGIFESYGELLGTNDRAVILRYLHALAHERPKGHWLCPCGSGKRLRECHRDRVQELRAIINQEEAARALGEIRSMEDLRAKCEQAGVDPIQIDDLLKLARNGQ